MGRYLTIWSQVADHALELDCQTLVPVVLLSNCVTLGRLLNLSVSQLKMGIILSHRVVVSIK